MEIAIQRVKDSIGRWLGCGCLFHILLASACVALLPKAQAVSPPPDGGYPGGNTAEGQSALFSLTGGTFNTALGFSSLRSNTTGNLNTAVGAGALLVQHLNREHSHWRCGTFEQHHWLRQYGQRCVRLF